MSAVFKKLNLTTQREILVVNPPASFEGDLSELSGLTVLRAIGSARRVGFALAFVQTQKEVNALTQAISRKAEGDAVIWFAYPKGSSKNYQCDFNRDTGWAAMGEAGWEPVRMVAIDEDWSALRFRRVEFIKKLTRKTALTAQGKQRIV